MGRGPSSGAASVGSSERGGIGTTGEGARTPLRGLMRLLTFRDRLPLAGGVGGAKLVVVVSVLMMIGDRGHD